MNLGELNFISLLLFLLFFTLLANPTTTLQYLLTAELLWITIYCMAVFVAFILDDTNVLSLTLFFLVLSAVEISIGFILVAFQSITLNSSLVIDNKSTNFQFLSRLAGRMSIAKGTF